MPETTSKVSPVVAIAAVSVIIFSAVGVGVMTGFIPSSISRTDETPVKLTVPQAATPVPAEQPKQAAPLPAEQPKQAAPLPAEKRKQAARVSSEKPKHAAPAPQIQTAEPVYVATAEPVHVATAEPARTAQACTNCGSVISVNLVKQEGEGSGLGAIGGAVVGGVLGRQVGSGRGRDVATVVGAGAGAYAGHQIEKNVKTTQSYNVAVRMDDGSTRNFPYQSEPAFRAGDKVKVVEGRLVVN